MEDVFWWHSIDLGDRVTAGHKSPELLENEWANMRMPDLAGKSVLDIGCWDGWFSFRAEREGAARVVALDHYVWSLDLPASRPTGATVATVASRPSRTTTSPRSGIPTRFPARPDSTSRTKRCRAAVEPVVTDFMTTDLDALGAFDVVFYFGVLYHVEEPLTALRRVRREQATHRHRDRGAGRGGPDPTAVRVRARRGGQRRRRQLVDTDESGLHGLCRAAGFREVETVAGAPPGLERYRLVVHARV